MADKNDHKDRRTKKKGLISTVLSSPLSLFFMLIVSAFVSSIFEIVGMATEFWDEPGIAHSDSMLRQEIIYAELNLSNNIITAISGVSVQTMFDNSIKPVFDLFNSIGRFESARYTHGFGAYVGAVVNMFLITFLRCFVFIFSLPLYFIFCYVGFTIGVFERDRRKAGGARESGTRFTLAKNGFIPFISIAFFIYLAFPDSINPVFIIFPSAVLCGISSAYFFTFFKKHG